MAYITDWERMTSHYTFQSAGHVPVKVRNEMFSYKPPWMDSFVRDGRTTMSIRHIPECWSPASPEAFPVENDYRVTSYRDPSEDESHAEEKHYPYRDLTASDEIRTLLLLPGQGKQGVQIRLEHLLLQNHPGYEAISYAWGDKSDTCSISCDGGGSITIPYNLFRALEQLQHPTEVRRIWADAICINQSDNIEKGHQVRLMRRIFQNASKVLIWLGLDTDLHFGIDHSVTAGDVFQIITEMYHKDFSRVPPPSDLATWGVFERLFECTWFWRLWCLQEAVLAPSAEVVWGKYSVPWEHVGFAALWVRHMPVELVQSGGKGLVGVYDACLIYSLSHGYQHQRKVSFLQLLTLARAFLATDPRDKVYGLLGVPTTDANPDNGELFMEPDYEKSTADVYLECAMKIIETSKSLRILSYVQHERLVMPWRLQEYDKRFDPRLRDRTLLDVPSWVPRWHQYFTRTLAPSDPKRTFDSASGLDTSRIRIEDRKLLTQGIRFSTVRAVSGRPMMGEHPDEINLVWQRFVANTKSYGKEADLLEVLYTTIAAGKDWYGSIIENKEQHFADFVAYMYAPHKLGNLDIGYGHPYKSGRFFLCEERYFDDDSSQEEPLEQNLTEAVSSDNAEFSGPQIMVLDSPSSTHQTHDPAMPDNLQSLLFRPQTNKAFPSVVGAAHRFKEAFSSACYQRRFLITQNGYVGLAPQVTEPGDLVCILAGAIVPLVLRPVEGGEFQLVGEAYIHGIMSGEACRGLDSNDLKDFVLSSASFAPPPEWVKADDGNYFVDRSVADVHYKGMQVP